MVGTQGFLALYCCYKGHPRNTCMSARQNLVQNCSPRLSSAISTPYQQAIRRTLSSHTYRLFHHLVSTWYRVTRSCFYFHSGVTNPTCFFLNGYWPLLVDLPPHFSTCTIIFLILLSSNTVSVRITSIVISQVSCSSEWPQACCVAGDELVILVPPPIEQ